MSKNQLFTFPVSAMQFCAWITPLPGPQGREAPLKYGMAFPVAEVPDAMADLIPRWVETAEDSERQLLNVRSNMRPSIHDITDTTANLIFLRQQLDAMNIPLEKAVRGAPGEISVLLSPIRHHAKMPDRHDLMAMALVAVRFDAAAIHVPSWDDVVGKMGGDS